MDYIGLDWFTLVQTGLSCFKLDYTGLDLIIQVWIRLDQIGLDQI